MQKQTPTKQSAQLNIQENVENSHKENSTLAESEQIQGTPFTLRRDDTKWFMTMGDYRVTETTLTKEEQLEKLETEKWLLIMHICILAIEKLEQIKYVNPYTQKQQNKKDDIQYETESL